MLILKCTTYDKKSVFINMSEVLFFHDNGKGGTVFIYGTKAGKDVLLNQYVTQKPDQIHELLRGEKYFQCTSFDDTKVFVDLGKVAFFKKNDKGGTVFIFSLLISRNTVMNQHVKESPDDVYFMIIEHAEPDQIIQ